MSDSDTSDPEAVSNAGREARQVLAEHASKIVEYTWKKMMAVAQNHISMGKIDENGRTITDQEVRTGFYNRERQMVHNLETLFSITHESQGYLSFLSTLTAQLDADNPVAMAFLSHILERSALPDRETLKQASDAILEKLNKKPGRLQRMISLLSGRYRDAARKELVRKQITNHFVVNTYMNPVMNPLQVKLKLNSAILWSLLADKFAGELSTHIWQDKVGSILIESLANPQEEILVRVFSLLALEKFAATAHCKQRIDSLGTNMRELLLEILKECNEANYRILLLSFGDSRPMSSLFTPPVGPLREEWAKYAQLKMCALWALDHAFKNDNQITCPWDLKRLRIILNPYDATSGMKLTNNGLELRNDRNHFESVRATACVKRGKWYYEAQLLSHGIIQIGWATSRCRFSPDEGYGVGDDCNGFAFDTFRSAVWADGICVHPNGNRRVRCSVGDVVGTLLDLDNGACTYYINGKDVGMTVEFENPKGAAKSAQSKNAQATNNTRTNNASSTTTRATNTTSTANNTNTIATRSGDLPSTEHTIAGTARTTNSGTILSTSRPANDTTSTTTGVSDNTTRSANDTSSDNNITNHVNNTPLLTSMAPPDQFTQQPSRNGPQSRSKQKKGLGLYPAISLTTNQHVRVNFGDEPWMYRPPITYPYWGINQAGELDEYFKEKVYHWVHKRGRIAHGKSFGPTNTQPLRPRYGADEIPEGQLHFSDSSDEEDTHVHADSEEDKSTTNLCTICYSEPANITLLPCKHGDIGSQCAAIINKW
ncbi:hypothetical protein G6F43_011236 [Rhizopus delemar]|nr:hypothetical protein G6F43_011236 [Rhizopus delemar]